MDTPHLDDLLERARGGIVTVVYDLASSLEVGLGTDVGLVDISERLAKIA